MATTATQTTDLAPDLVLTAPDAVVPVAAERASGLVPLEDEAKTKLDAKAENFVAELVAQDANSPEFGRRVDLIADMGRTEIAAAAGQSNRFLDRPVRSMDKESGVGSDLAELRRTIEDLDPGKRGSLTAPKKLFGISAVRQQDARLFRQL